MAWHAIPWGGHRVVRKTELAAHPSCAVRCAPAPFNSDALCLDLRLSRRRRGESAKEPALQRRTPCTAYARPCVRPLVGCRFVPKRGRPDGVRARVPRYVHGTARRTHGLLWGPSDLLVPTQELSNTTRTATQRLTPHPRSRCCRPCSPPAPWPPARPATRSSSPPPAATPGYRRAGHRVARMSRRAWTTTAQLLKARMVLRCSAFRPQRRHPQLLLQTQAQTPSWARPWPWPRERS